MLTLLIALQDWVAAKETEKALLKKQLSPLQEKVHALKEELTTLETQGNEWVLKQQEYQNKHVELKQKLHEVVSTHSGVTKQHTDKKQELIEVTQRCIVEQNKNKRLRAKRQRVLKLLEEVKKRYEGLQSSIAPKISKTVSTQSETNSSVNNFQQQTPPWLMYDLRNNRLLAFKAQIEAAKEAEEDQKEREKLRNQQSSSVNSSQSHFIDTVSDTGRDRGPKAVNLNKKKVNRGMADLASTGRAM